MSNKSSLLLETDRLILRWPEPRDISDLIEGLNNLDVSASYGAVPFPYTEEHAIRWIAKCFKQRELEEKSFYSFQLEHKNSGRMIGGVILNHINYFFSGASLGYWINKKYWKQGLVGEAISKVIEFGFRNIGLRRIYLFSYADNKASNQVAKKFGFELEGKLRKSHVSLATKEIHDANSYALLREDWEKNK